MCFEKPFGGLSLAYFWLKKTAVVLLAVPDLLTSPLLHVGVHAFELHSRNFKVIILESEKNGEILLKNS